MIKPYIMLVANPLPFVVVVCVLVQMFFKEIILTSIYVAGYLVIPEIAKINRLPIWVAWLLLLPLLFVNVPDQGDVSLGTIRPPYLDLWCGSKSPQALPQ